MKRLVSGIHVNIDDHTGDLPKLSWMKISGRDVVAWHFSDVVIWLRADQLPELLTTINAAMASQPIAAAAGEPS